MTMTAAPVAVKERFGSMDVLRGVAVCGILLMNIPFMGMLGDSGRPPLPAAPNLDWIAFTIQDVVFSGSMRGMFTLLFGAGMLIMLRRADEPVRHKMLDAMGDLALAGGPILGRYVASRAGHSITNRLLRQLFATPCAWQMVDCAGSTMGKLPGVGVVRQDIPAYA